MKTVGIRELKDRLSEYLRMVRAGDAVLVTDRGEVVAELVPPGREAIDPSLSPGLVTLARRGMATLAAGGRPDYPPLPRSGKRVRTAAQLLDDERGPR